LDIKESGWEFYSIGAEQYPVAKFCEHGDEPSESIRYYFHYYYYYYYLISASVLETSAGSREQKRRGVLDICEMTSEVGCSFSAMSQNDWTSHTWLVNRMCATPCPIFFIASLKNMQLPFRLDQIFQSRGDSCLGGSSRNQDEPVYNFVNSDKEPPFIILWGGGG
jgi:hypothetical protein